MANLNVFCHISCKKRFSWPFSFIFLSSFWLFVNLSNFTIILPDLIFFLPLSGSTSSLLVLDWGDHLHTDMIKYLSDGRYQSTLKKTSIIDVFCLNLTQEVGLDIFGLIATICIKVKNIVSFGPHLYDKGKSVGRTPLINAQNNAFLRCYLPKNWPNKSDLLFSDCSQWKVWKLEASIFLDKIVHPTASVRQWRSNDKAVNSILSPTQLGPNSFFFCTAYLYMSEKMVVLYCMSSHLINLNFKLISSIYYNSIESVRQTPFSHIFSNPSPMSSKISVQHWNKISI